MPFLVASKNMKCIGISLSKYSQESYIEKYRTLLRKSEKDINECWDILCWWIRRYNIVKMPIIPKLIYKFNTISIKISEGIFVEGDKLNLKFIWNYKVLIIAKSISMNIIGGITLFHLKIYYNVIVLKNCTIGIKIGIYTNGTE